MEDDGFFGFDTSLPPLQRGPQQEYGDVELEDTYDALNDETFGIINADDDWEEQHEQLAKLLDEKSRNDDESLDIHYNLEDEEEECAYPGPQPKHFLAKRLDDRENFAFDQDNEDAADVAASVSQLILDDEDIEALISKPNRLQSKSIGAKLYSRMSPSSSLFDSDVVGSPSTPSIWSTQPSEIRKPPAKEPSRIVLANTVSNGQMSLPTSGGGVHPSLLPQAFKTVEELERDLLLQHQPKPMTMEELERNILSKAQMPLPLPTGQMRSVEELEAELTRTPQKAQQKPPGIAAPAMAHPNAHPHQMRAPFMGPLGPHLPPPMGMSLPPPHPPGMLLPAGMAPMRLNGPVVMNGPPPPPPMMPWPPRFPPNVTAPQQPPTSMVSTSGTPPNRERDADRARQMRNANDRRYSEDDYDEYAGLMSTKEKQWLMSIQINQLISDNPYVDDYYYTVLRLRRAGTVLQGGKEGKEGPKLILPERAKTETRTYAPTQFANSLGKLQVVTYTAPRRIIDVNVIHGSPDSNQDPQMAAKDLRKFKQILLDIETMYVWLLELEDAEKRVEALPDDSAPGPHHQAAADYQQRLQACLSTGDRLLQVMFVRKGKALVLRTVPRLNQAFRDLFTRTFLSNCVAIIRRDAQDHFLARFLPTLNEAFAACRTLEELVSMAAMLECANKSGGFAGVVSTKMGLEIVSMLLIYGRQLYPKNEKESVQGRWNAFVNGIADALLEVGAASVPQLDIALLTLEPFEQVGLDQSKLNALQGVVDRLVNGTHHPTS